MGPSGAIHWLLLAALLVSTSMPSLGLQLTLLLHEMAAALPKGDSLQASQFR